MRKAIDLTGQQFGEWTVLEQSTKTTKSKNVFWKVQCSCGTISEVSGADLRRGKTTKCKQHYSSNKTPKSIPKFNPNISRLSVVDETNNQYGRLTVIKQVESDRRGAAQWLCQCSCGNFITTRGTTLREGKISSCGCLGSHGEGKILSILQANNIKYQRQYSFNDLVGACNSKLKFDFAIFDDDTLKCLIEFQGSQHYNFPDVWSNGESLKTNDLLKKQYCEAHNIKLVIIPYWDLKQLDLNYLLQHIN